MLLVSTGSEESFMEGMRGWVRRHGPALDPARTRVVVLETLGSPELILLEGEGMIWMNDYDPELRDFIAESAAAGRRAAAARAAARLRHRRAVGAARRAPGGHARLLRRVQDARQLPLAARHPAQRELRDRRGRRPGRRVGDQDSSERASLSASSRVRDLARVARLLELREQRPELRPGLEPQLGRELVAAHERRRAARRRAAPAPARAPRGRARDGRRSPRRRSCRAWRGGRRR